MYGTEKEINEHINSMQKIDLCPGYGTGKVAAVICLTKYISLSSKLASTKTYEIIKRYLKEVLDYKDVFFASTFMKKQVMKYDFFKGSIRYIQNEGCLDDADDIFQVQASLNMFGGYIFDDFYYNCLRIDEWYRKHGDGHYFVIQDDPYIHRIDPFPNLIQRQFEYGTVKYTVSDDIISKYKDVWQNVQQCIRNAVVANCGSSYPNFLRKLSHNDKRTPLYIKAWCEFPIYTFQAMNDNVSEKLKSYEFTGKKYMTEYHGYCREAPRMAVIDSFYSAVPAKTLCITTSARMFRNMENYDVVKGMYYNNLIPFIGKNAKATFVTADSKTFNDFISPRFFDAMLSDVIAFIYLPYDEERKYINDSELKDFMYVSRPEEFADKVLKVSNDESFFRHVKYLQRKAVYEKYCGFCNEESRMLFERWLQDPFNNDLPYAGSAALF